MKNEQMDMQKIKKNLELIKFDVKNLQTSIKNGVDRAAWVECVALKQAMGLMFPEELARLGYVV